MNEHATSETDVSVTPDGSAGRRAYLPRERCNRS
jgi:hypothetical protein